jgi:vacuolar-type H+-ATPase subunit H
MKLWSHMHMADDDKKTQHHGAEPGATENPTTSAQEANIVQEKPRQTVEQAKQDAREIADRAQAHAKSMLDEQKHAAAGQVDGFAKALRKTSEQLNAQDQGPVAHYVERAAESLDNLSATLRDQDISSLVTQVQDYAKRQPVVFMGGAIAAGFLVARFLKSSSSPLSSPSSSPSDEPYAGTSTDEPYPETETPRYPSSGSTSGSESTPI